MNNIDTLEETLHKVVPLLLAGPGLILVGSGLFLWLAGLRWLKPLAGFIAAAAGFACAWLFTSRQLVPMVCFTLIPAALALFLDKAIVAAFGACLAGAIVLLFPLFADAALRRDITNRLPSPPAVQDVSLFASLEFLKEMPAWFADWAEMAWKLLPAGRKTVAVGVIVAVLVVGVLAWRWVCALTCSTLGTLLIFSGMGLLLLSKGPQAIAYITDKMPYLGLLVVLMAVLGAFINRWLCPLKVKSKKIQPPESVNGEKK